MTRTMVLAWGAALLCPYWELWQDRLGGCVVYSDGGDVHEDAHSDCYGCGVFRLHFIATTFDTGSCSSAPDGSSHAGECGGFLRHTHAPHANTAPPRRGCRAPPRCASPPRPPLAPSHPP